MERRISQEKKEEGYTNKKNRIYHDCLQRTTLSLFYLIRKDYAIMQ